MDQQDRFSAQIRYKDIEQVFTGSIEEVWLSLNKFFNGYIPAFETANILMLNVDLKRLVEDCQGIIAFSAEGTNVLVSREKMTDTETLTLWLLATHIGQQLGFPRSEDLTKEGLQAKLGKNPKITATRLGELVKNGLAIKTGDTYKITTLCIVQMQKDTLPRIKNKLQI